MSLRHLRTIRVVVSLLFFFLVAFVFLDVGNHIPPSVSNFLFSLQFGPSAVKLFVGIGSSAIGILVVLLLTIAFGRVYCSSICPLGTLQDAFIFIANRIKGKRRFRYKRSDAPIHYAILAVTLVCAVFGSLLFVDVLDPFSNFGRIATNIVRPALLYLNNAAAGVLNNLQIYTLYQIPTHALDVSVVVFASLFLLLVVYLCLDRGRLFCNLLCPVGAILRLVSRFSLYKIAIDTSTCKDCGLCEKVCKARCIDSKEKRIEFGSCISCFNCIDVCPTVGVVYEALPWMRKESRNVLHDPARRKVVNTLSSALTLAGSSTVLGTGVPDSTKFLLKRSKYPVTPPGSSGVDRFSQLCTACHLCVSACPTQVITPSFLEYGVQGMFQPRLDYTTSYCMYECTICGQVCPSGAIVRIDTEAKKEVQVGKAQFIKDDCIVVAKKTECGACSEHCPTKAVSMIPYEKLHLPELNNDICVGCGACERACPTKPTKAIFVESNPIHLRAKKPQIKKLEPDVPATQDFPF